jgi:hypothetical protein
MVINLLARIFSSPVVGSASGQVGGHGFSRNGARVPTSLTRISGPAVEPWAVHFTCALGADTANLRGCLRRDAA